MMALLLKLPSAQKVGNLLLQQYLVKAVHTRDRVYQFRQETPHIEAHYRCVPTLERGNDADG